MVSFTGAGWLSWMLIGMSVIVCTVLLMIAAEQQTYAGVLLALGIQLGASPVHWYLGRALNSRRTPQGREWHNTHMFSAAPMQYGAAVHVGLALLVVAVVVGVRTSSVIVGVIAFFGTPIAVLVASGFYDRWRRMRGVADRKRLARTRGWQYKNFSLFLVDRWMDLFGKKSLSAIRPFGIVAGQLDGVPFTVFDSQAWMPVPPGIVERRHTTWVVHLPVAYPRVVVWNMSPEAAAQFRAGWSIFDIRRYAVLAGWANDGELVVDARNTDFAHALWTPEIREATLAHRLFDWRIEGRDLIWSEARETPPTADELVRVAEHLVELARVFPPELAERYGTEPTTDLPLQQATSSQRQEPARR